MKSLIFILLFITACSLNQDEDDQIKEDENFAPTLVKKQNDLRLVFGTSSKRIDLNQIFNDPNGDPLSYSFSFSNTRFFTTNVSANQYLEFSFNEYTSDSVSVYLTASDEYGESCSDTFDIIINAEAPISFSIVSTDILDQFSIRAVSSHSIDMNRFQYEWKSNSDKIQFQNKNSYSTKFDIPHNETEFTVDLSLISTKNNIDETKIKQLTIPFLTESRRFGLGKVSQIKKSNNRSYGWYFDQMNTGTYSGINCGPTTTTMAIKWADENFTKTPEDARNTFRPNGGWWYTTDIQNYLSQNNVHHSTIALYNMSAVKDQIDNNNIVILCLDMYYVKANLGKDERRVDKFYSTNGTGWGHFIVIKGYRMVDSKIFYEAYDPYSFGKKYENNTIKGINRFYRSESLNAATNVWWDYAIVVSKSSGKIVNALKPNEIPAQRGR